MKAVNFQLSSAFCPEFTCAAESILLFPNCNGLPTSASVTSQVPATELQQTEAWKTEIHAVLFW